MAGLVERDYDDQQQRVLPAEQVPEAQQGDDRNAKAIAPVQRRRRPARVPGVLLALPLDPRGTPEHLDRDDDPILECAHRLLFGKGAASPSCSRATVPDYPGITSCIGQTAVLGSHLLSPDQYLPSPRPSGGHWSSLALASACQGQWLFLGALKAGARPC